MLNVFAEQSPASAAPCRFLMRTGTPAQAEAGFHHHSCLLLGQFDDLGRFRNTTIGFWEVHPVTVRLEKSRERRCNCGWYFDFACCGRAAAYVIMCLQTGVRPHSTRLVQRKLGCWLMRCARCTAIRHFEISCKFFIKIL